MLSTFRITFIGFLILLFACNNNKQANETKSANGLALSSIRLSTLNGEPVDWKQYEGKTLFINVWATWCKPCLQEMPSIQNMMENFKKENIAFLFASDETAEQIDGFKKENGFPFTFVRLENPEELNIMALPTTFIYNAKGELVFSEMGYRKWDSRKNIDFIKNKIASK